jgi:hypothetical protein
MHGLLAISIYCSFLIFNLLRFAMYSLASKFEVLNNYAFSSHMQYKSFFFDYVAIVVDE